jgi:lipid II:glycine glycyltransferase (peptidoglycan interpeptide bridge formation enzyme)
VAGSAGQQATTMRSPGTHFLQSWQWGELKVSQGWRAHRYAVEKDGRVLGAFSLLHRPISRRPRLVLGYIPRGPIVIDGKYLAEVMRAIREAGEKHGCFAVKADPDFEVSSPLGTAWEQAARENGWQYSRDQIQPRATGITDLLPDDPDGEAKLLSGMSKRWRYNVGLGPKRGIETTAVRDNDFRQFYQVYEETGQRQGFGVRSLDYYQAVADLFADGDSSSAQLFVATHPEEKLPLAGAFVLSFGQRWWYFYGASSSRRRADMPTYCLQWATQRWARDHGGKTYDWWGAPEDPENKNDRRYSVWHFKKGFGPRHVLTVGAWDLPLKPNIYRSYTTIERLRRRIARLRAGF